MRSGKGKLSLGIIIKFLRVDLTDQRKKCPRPQMRLLREAKWATERAAATRVLPSELSRRIVVSNGISARGLFGGSGSSSQITSLLLRRVRWPTRQHRVIKSSGGQRVHRATPAIALALASLLQEVATTMAATLALLMLVSRS